MTLSGNNNMYSKTDSDMALNNKITDTKEKPDSLQKVEWQSFTN